MAVTWALLSRKAVSGERNATVAMEPNREIFSFPVQPGRGSGNERHNR